MSMTATFTRPNHPFGEFCDLLIEHFPEHKTPGGAFNVQAFAAALGYSSETVYKALRERGLLKTAVAHKMIAHSHENQSAVPLYWPDVVRFLLPDFAIYGEPKDVDDLLG